MLVEKNRIIYIPGPNVLTKTMRVAPGSQVSATLGTHIISGRLNVDVSYNLFFREKETVTLDHTHAWPSRVYGALTYADNGGADFDEGAPIAGHEEWTLVDLSHHMTPARYFKPVMGLR